MSINAKPPPDTSWLQTAEVREGDQRREGWAKRPGADPAGKSTAVVQWKGTDVCLDLHCRCGEHGHLDGDFAYFLRCVACGRVYEMPHTFDLVQAEKDQAFAIREPMGESHAPRLDGPAVVDVRDAWSARDA